MLLVEKYCFVAISLLSSLSSLPLLKIPVVDSGGEGRGGEGKREL